MAGLANISTATRYAREHLVALHTDAALRFAMLPWHLLEAELLPRLRPVPAVHAATCNPFAFYYCGQYFIDPALPKYAHQHTCGMMAYIDCRDGYAIFTQKSGRIYQRKLQPGDSDILFYSEDTNRSTRAMMTITNIYTGQRKIHV